MRLIINWKRIIANILITFIILYSFTPGLTSTLFIMNGKGIYLVFLCAIGYFAALNHFIITYSNKYFIIVSIAIMMFVVLINNYNVKNGSYDQLAHLLTFFALLLFWSGNSIWIEGSAKIIFLLSLFFMVMTIYELINYPFFENNVMPLFDSFNSVSYQITNHRQRYVAGFNANPGVDATILAVGFGLSYSYYRFEKNHIWAIATLLFIASIFITGKRGHALFTLMSLAISFLLTNNRNISKYAKALLTITIAIGLIFLVSNYIPALQNVIYRFHLSDSSDYSTGRFTLWKEAFELFLNKPIFGNGWDSIKYMYGVNTHNVYLQLLAETGIVGFSSFLVFFIMMLRHCISVNKQRSNKYLNFSLFFQLFFLLYCLTGNPLYDATSLFPYVIACGYSEYYYRLLKLERDIR